MMKFSNEQIKRLKKDTEAVMSGINEGKSTREIMAQIYVDKLENKSLEQGLAMADEMIESVRKFDSDYMQAREDIDKYLEGFAKNAEKGKTVQERCDYWLRLAASVTSAGIALNDKDADRAKLFEELKNLSVPENEATEEKACELREKAFEAIKNSGILILGIEEAEKEISEMESAEKGAELLVDFGDRHVDARAVMSMIAYTEVKRGAFENVPVEMTASQIATAVCAGEEELRIAEGVERGSILMEVATVMLAALGAVVIVGITCALAYVGLTATPYLFSAFLATSANVIMVYGLLKLSKMLIEKWCDASKIIVRYVSKGIKMVSRGFRAVVDFIKNRVIPGAVNIAKKLWNGIKSMFGGKKTKEEETVKPETVTDEEEIVEIVDGKVVAAV